MEFVHSYFTQFQNTHIPIYAGLLYINATLLLCIATKLLSNILSHT